MRRNTWAVIGRLLLGAGLVATALVVTTGGAAGADDADSPAEIDPFVDVPSAVFDVARRSADASAADDTIVRVRPRTFRALELNRNPMETLLAGAAVGTPLRIELPGPDGTAQSFDIEPSDVLAPELAAKYPEIRTFDGRGVTDPAASIVLDLVPQGFHAQVLSPSGAWYIDPAIHLRDDLHVSYLRSEARSTHETYIERQIPDIDQLRIDEAADRDGPPAASRAGATLRTHRIAVTADDQYSAFHIEPGSVTVGEKVADVQAAIATVVSRVSGIYQQEIAVKLQLIGDNDLLTFIDASGSCTGTAKNIASISSGEVTTTSSHGLSDGIVQIAGSSNSSLDGKWAIIVTGSTTFELQGTSGSAGAVGTVRNWDIDGGNPTCSPFTFPSNDDELELNQAIVDRIVGTANYDVGHLVTTSSGGFAFLGVVGDPLFKAGGTTGLPDPTGDPFYIDYVAHELGHQYGGDHTFNGTRLSCDGNIGDVSYEPGSGSTIQAYAGICDLDDLQREGDSADSDGASDPYFHSGSFDQIMAHLATPAGASAGSSSPSGNAEPTVDAGDDITIPAQTPFFLNASGTDADSGDTLTYNFEQRDAGTGRRLEQPRVTSGPLFRSFPATTNRRSTFPRMSELLDSNTNQLFGTCASPPDGTLEKALCWSQFLVPTSGPVAVGASRDLNFRATVRDGAGTGSSAGGVSTDDTVVTVHNTGTPFEALTPAAFSTHPASRVPVTWEVAGTTAAPISASTVSIRVSTDGGLTFPTEVLRNTPNDGTATIAVVPNVAQSDLRLMVHSGDYVDGGGFFDFLDFDFGVTVDRPGVRIFQAAGQADPAFSETVNFTVVFNELVTGFTSGDVVLGGTAGATTATVSGSGSTYNVAVTGMTKTGTVTASVPANAASGPNGPNYASNDVDNDNVVTYDARPTLAVNQAVGQPDPTTASPIRFTAVFSKPVTGFAGSDVVLGGTAGATSAVVTGSGASYEIAVSGMTDDGTVTASVPAGAASAGANPNLASTSTDNRVTFEVPIPETVSLDPARVFASRSSDTTVDGRFENTGRLLADDFVEVAISGRGGVSPTGAKAVVMNVTAINPSGRGFVTTYPCGTRPLASSLNYGAAGAVIGNELVAKLSPTGTVCVYTSAETDLTIDVVGFVPTTSGIVSLDPARLYATRAGDETADRGQEAVGRIAADAVVEVPIAGRGGVAQSGAGSVVMNITAINPDGRGFITTYPCGRRPLASSLNFDSAGAVVGNELIAKLSAARSVCVYSSASTDLTIDVVGYVPTSSAATSLDPARMFATRSTDMTVDGQQQNTGRISADGVVEVVVGGRAGVPASGAGAVVMNITAINPDGRGFVTTYPCGTRPLASSLNYGAAGAVIGNELVAKLSSSGTVCVFTSAATDLTVDVVGYIPA